MKILQAWLIAICLSCFSWSLASDFESKIAIFAHSPEWLGHFFYDGDRSGYTSLVESKHYFFSPTGKYNPEDELKETIRRLSLDELPADQYCHYIGRFELVLSVFPEYRKAFHTCKPFEEWKLKLSLDTVRLSFAAEHIKNPASSFGHLFLKLLSRNQASELLSYGINFSAQTGDDTGALYALKGLFGQYPGGFVFLPYHQLIKDYSDLEGRDIWELDLNLDDSAKERLLRLIYEFDSNYIDYTFLNNNCAGILERLVSYLQQRPASTAFTIKPWTIPLESLQNMALNQSDKKFYYSPSLKTQLSHMEERLTLEEKKAIKAELKTRHYDQLNNRSLDYVLLDKKINESKLDDAYYFKLLSARSRMPVDEGGALIEMPKPVVTDRPRTSSIGLISEKHGPGFSFNLLNQRLIYRHSLSEINAFNFHARTNSKKKLVLKDAEIFNFLAGESVNFLRDPVSYGGGLFYRDKKELSIELNAGYLLNQKDWMYFPKLQFRGDKFQTRLSPELDVFYFSRFANWKLNLNDLEFRLEAFRLFDNKYSVSFNTQYQVLAKESEYTLGLGYFF